GIEELPRSVQRAVERAVTTSGMVRGHVFVEEDFAAAEWRVRHALEDRAYAFAKVERSARVDLPEHKAAVTFAVTPDQPATIGKITITGLGSLPEAPVRRALDLSEGERYSASALDSAQQAVLDLGVFSSVAVRPERPEPPPPDRAVPLTVEVT